MLLGIDLGTSSVKAVLFDPDTRQVRAVANQEYPIHNPKIGYAEQNPADWWQAAVATVRQVAADADVTAIGITGQMHGTVLLDAEGTPVHPAIIWADQRSAAAGAYLLEQVKDYASIAGTRPVTGFMAATLRWLVQNTPAVLEKAAVVLLPKDYLRYRLTGAFATDISDAAATGLFDITYKNWSSAIVRVVGLPFDLLPEVLPSQAVSGQLSAAAADALGLNAGLPVVAGCADQPAQAIANGLVKPGQASVTLGTGGQVFVPLRLARGEAAPTDPRLHVFNHAVPEALYVLGAILSAGLSMRWLRNLLAVEDYSTLSQAAATVAPGADGLVFLPYLGGERTPHMDSQARGAFIGLSYHHTRAHMARAVMEGVVFALRQALEISLSLTGDVEMIVAAGGGADSAVWRQMQADIYGLPLRRTRLTEQTCTGAALLAGVGTGVYRDFDEAAPRDYDDPVTPDAEVHARYNQNYAHFKELYPRLRSDFHRLVQ